MARTNSEVADMAQTDRRGVAEQPTGGFVLGLGPLVKSNEFYLAVNSREIRDKLILCGNIVVKERNFKIRSTDATRFTARIHWAPPFVPSGAIAEALGTECNVETIVYEMCKEERFETVQQTYAW